VSDLGEVSSGKLIISAHGVGPGIVKTAEKRKLDIVDTTCPLVVKVHRLVERLVGDGCHVIVFGDPDHDETRGIVGHANSRMITVISGLSDAPETIPGRCALISQTTQSVDDFEELSDGLSRRLPGVLVYNTICKPTMRRQKSAIALAHQCEFVYVVGSATSANSRRLISITREICGCSILVDSPNQVCREQLSGARVVGLTAGASSPDSLIAAVIRRLCRLFDTDLITAHQEFATIVDEVSSNE
jgi:4-hydroxy-3-methylbut-2-enyl diphosphate reductase